MSDKNPPHPVIAHLTSPAKFGTQTRLAAAAECKPHTISGKRDSDNPLTLVQMTRILRNGPELGVAVEPADFFPEFRQDAAA